MKELLYQLMTGKKPVSLPENITAVFLKIFSVIYLTAVSALSALYSAGILKKHEFSKPVISVGNLTWGGTGKTPLVIWIGQQLKQKNRNPAVLMRGYMPDSKDSLSDEALVIGSAGLAVYPGSDRIQSGQEALADGAGALLLDDGFQQWRIKKNLEIVVVDATDPFGNRSVLPAGILREPISALKRADFFVLTKTDCDPKKLTSLRDELKAINPQAPIAETVHRPESLVDLDGSKTIPLDTLKGRRVLAFCSIARPESFRKSLESLSAKVQELISFRDHHLYNTSEIDGILKKARDQKIQTLVTTKKDAVKLTSLLKDQTKNIQIFYLAIQIQFIRGEHELIERIAHL